MKAQEIVLPLALIFVIASLLVPVPPVVLDCLIITNLLFALGLVTIALQSTDAMKLSVLPTILLLSTLFRLCLNVSTTRLILSQARGGEVVEAFGSFVLQGNIAVGLVLFLMLSLIQFIVIAKGSERVAEVAARFTLDALPGKQMSIDADVRSGLYDLATARQKRQELQTESRFYGALDGSMKFVKGDAIAALCIVFINIVGGLLIGILSGKSIGDAAHIYTVLTVGDGLSSQIPALLNSLAAGLVVTRVGQGKNESLSTELIEQVLQSKGGIILGGLAAISMGCVPGMPMLPMIGIGVVFLFFGLFKKKTINKEICKHSSFEFKPKGLHLIEILTGILDEKDFYSYRSFSENLRKKMFESCGILLPVIPITMEESSDKRIKLALRGIIICEVDINNVSSDEQRLDLFLKCLLKCREECIDDNHTRRLLDWYEQYSPELVSSVVPHVLSLTQCSELIKGLISEKISIRHFDRILQGIAEMAPKVGVESSLIEEVRTYIKRSIHFQFFTDKTELKVATLDDEFETLLSEQIKTQMIIDPRIMKETAGQIDIDQSQIDAVIVTKSLRRQFAEILRIYGIETPVLSHVEIMPHITVKTVFVLSTPLFLLENENASYIEQYSH